MDSSHCNLQPKDIIHFLNQISNVKDELQFARSLTEDNKSLCMILEGIKPLLETKPKRKITSFLKKAKATYS